MTRKITKKRTYQRATRTKGHDSAISSEFLSGKEFRRLKRNENIDEKRDSPIIISKASSRKG